jgi:HSP20 family protein
MSMVLRRIYDDLIDDLVCDFTDYYGDDVFDYFDEPTSFTIIPVAIVQLPVLEVKELDNEYTIDLELPGYSKEDINIEMDGDIITVSSDLKDKEFYRSIQVSEYVKPEEISANMDKGILTLRIPKKELPPARKIEIKVLEEPKKLEVKETTPEVKETTPEVKETQPEKRE